MTGRRQATETTRGAAGGASTRPGTAKAPGDVRAKTRRDPPRFVIDANLCKSCGICIQLCPHGVFKADDEGRPVVVDAAACTCCRFCEQHCPDFALELIEGGRPGPRSGGPSRAKAGVAPATENDEGDD